MKNPRVNHHHPPFPFPIPIPVLLLSDNACTKNFMTKSTFVYSKYKALDSLQFPCSCY